jgi:hypothetical protein
MIGTNQYAMATQGETMVMRCPGTPESQVTLPLGCHNVTCLMPCRLSGSNWHFPALTSLGCITCLSCSSASTLGLVKIVVLT